MSTSETALILETCIVTPTPTGSAPYLGLNRLSYVDLSVSLFKIFEITVVLKLLVTVVSSLKQLY